MSKDRGGDHVKGELFPAVVNELNIAEGVGAEVSGELSTGDVNLGGLFSYDNSASLDGGNKVVDSRYGGYLHEAVHVGGGNISLEVPGSIGVLGSIEGEKEKHFSKALSNECVVGRVVSKEKGVGDVFSKDNIPYNLFAGMVERKTNFLVLLGNGIRVRGLELLDEVLVSGSCETFALFGVKENVVDEEDSIGDGCGGSGAVLGDYEGACGVEVEVDSDIMILKSNERQGKAVVSAEPEGEGYEDGSSLGSGTVTVKTTSAELSKVRSISNHKGVSTLFADGVGEFVPDIHPVTIDLVDGGTTDLNFSPFNHSKTDSAAESESTGSRFSCDLKGSFEVYVGHEITISGDEGSY